MIMVRLFWILLLVLSESLVSIAQVCPIIPKPLSYIQEKGFFELGPQTQVICNNNADRYVPLFKKAIQDKIGMTLSDANPKNKIELIIDEPSRTKEAYQLLVTPNKILIRAGDQDGIFNGLMSLSQIIKLSAANKGRINIACLSITDAPFFGWRGFMLDEARHFFGVKKVKQILDWMAFYKLNRFHWHLTDAQGWRIDIKKYPQLSRVGGIGNFTDSLKKAEFYTHAQITEIVNYAAERNIIVIPEIDMPGHATAANKAYPEYNGGGSAAYPNFTFNPGKEKTYTFLTDIVKETADLFPSEMIHLGGDEVSFGAKAWETNPDVKELMKAQKLENLQMVENYFFKRMADSVFKLNVKVLAWDEALEANLNPNKTLLFWWRHDKPEQLQNALSKGYNVVLCPRLPLYFDFVQASDHKIGRKWEGKFNALEDVYNFPGDDASFKNQQVIGIQANLWTERIINAEQLDFMLFPRLVALAESAWTTQTNKNLTVFKASLKQHFELYKKAGLNFYDPATISLQ